MPDFCWHVDSLIIRGNTLFGFGWAFHRRQKIVELSFRLQSAGGGALGSIRADFGKPREDIKREFGDVPAALHSGFVVLGAAAAMDGPGSILLECTLADGSLIERAVPASRVVWLGREDDAGGNQRVLRQFFLFFRRGVHLVRAGKVVSLFEKIRRYLKGRPKSVIKDPADLARILQTHKGGPLTVILDHDLGGGANHYRERLVESLVHEDGTALILTYHVATLTHMLVVRDEGANLRYAISGLAFVLDAVESLDVREIVYNTGVSFARPEEIPQFLVALKAKTHARLKFLVHDYFMVCPSHFLLDFEGRFCRIPDLDACARCLPRNAQGFATLFAARDVGLWRSAWAAGLAAADEIVAFSTSSVDILQKAYPQIGADRISVIPHTVEYLRPGGVRVGNTDTLCIGVVGMIGFHKGARIVQALANEIKRRGAGIKVVVIGSIEASCDPDVVTETGPYHHDQLPDLIEKAGVNVMLFPSICPETFSYVVQELMDLQLPVASFDFGAPAERLSGYARGLVLGSMDAPNILDELISFHRRIHLAN